MRRVEDAYEGFGFILLVVDGEQVFHAGDSRGAEVEGLQYSAVERQELRGEAEFVFFEARDLQHFRHVAMVEDGVRREIFGDLAEARFQAGLASGAADAGFGVAHDAAGAIDYASLHKGADGQIGGGGVTAGI